MRRSLKRFAAASAGGYNFDMKTTLTQTSQSALIDRVSWATYESLLKDYAGYSGVRINYDRGKLEIMTPGPDHEFVSSSFDTLTQVTAAAERRDITPLRSTTFKRKDLERGFEPDSCFYIEHAAKMRGKKEIDLNVDPAPELVVEVDDTSPSLDKMPIYAKVGVREVWRYRKGKVTIYGLENALYEERENSLAFPEMNRAQLEAFIAQSLTLPRWEWMDAITAWVKKNKATNAPQ